MNFINLYKDWMVGLSRTTAADQKIGKTDGSRKTLKRINHGTRGSTSPTEQKCGYQVFLDNRIIIDILN